MRFEMPFERRNSVFVHLCAKAGQSPISIQTRQIGIPGCSLLEKLGGFGNSRVLGAHHAQVVIATAKDFSERCPVLPCCFRFCFRGWRLAHYVGRQPMLDHAMGALLLRRTFAKHLSNAIGNTTILVIFGRFCLVEDVLDIVLEFRFPQLLRACQRLLGLFLATKPPQILPKQVVRLAGLAYLLLFWSSY